MTEQAPPIFDRSHYLAELARFDAAICEANAVGQAQAGRVSPSHIGYGSHVFSRMCGAGVALMRLAPLSRWTRSDFEDWQFSAVAPHARAMLDGALLFHYLVEPPSSEDELRARVNIMHLNDCTRRVKLFTDIAVIPDQVERLQAQQEELRSRLTTNSYFLSLDPAAQKSCLAGRFLMIENRDRMVEKIGFEKGFFDAIYDLWSQHVHILPLSFHRMEPNGRGTGIENLNDRVYIGQALSLCAEVLGRATDKLVEIFPDVAHVREGMKSQFSPGPRFNKPRQRHKRPLDMPKDLAPIAKAAEMAFLASVKNR